MKRKTSITKIASILTVLAMVWGGVSCTPQAPVEPTKYTISFDSGVESITAEEGAVATEPTTAPEKTGYTFGGWLNGDAAYDWTQPVTSDLSLTAKWTLTEYTITYLPEGVETDNLTTYTIETETFELKAPTKAPDATKPNFVAWHNGEKPTEGNWDIVDSIEKGTTGDLTIVAEFSDVKPWIVTFDSDGGSKVKDQNVVDGNKATEPKAPTKDGYEFDGWYNGGTKFDFATAITSDIKLIAHWKQVITYTITFETDGGTEVKSQTIREGEKATKPADPKKLSYKFIGWNNGTSAYDWESKVNGNLTLTAQWEQLPPLPLWAPKDTAVTNTATLPSWGYAAKYEEDTNFGKVLSLDIPEGKSDAGYCKFTIELPTARDLSSKVIKLVFKADGNTNGKIKPVIYSTDGEYSEHNATNVDTASADWEYKYASVADMWQSGEYDGDGNLVANHNANKTQVNKIELAFQNCTANLKIAYLSICDDYNNTNEEILWTANALSVEDPISWTNATVSYVEDATYGSVYKVETTSDVNYPITNVLFPSPAKDFSAYEYLQITLKASVAPAADDQKIKVSIFTDDTHASEHNGCNIVAEDVGQFKSFSLKLSDFWAAWSEDNSIEKADLSKISNLKIEFGKYVGTVEIAEITLH